MSLFASVRQSGRQKVNPRSRTKEEEKKYSKILKEAAEDINKNNHRNEKIVDAGCVRAIVRLGAMRVDYSMFGIFWRCVVVLTLKVASYPYQF